MISTQNIPLLCGILGIAVCRFETLAVYVEAAEDCVSATRLLALEPPNTERSKENDVIPSAIRREPVNLDEILNNLLNSKALEASLGSPVFLEEQNARNGHDGQHLLQPPSTSGGYLSFSAIMNLLDDPTNQSAVESDNIALKTVKDFIALATPSDVQSMMSAGDKGAEDPFVSSGSRPLGEDGSGGLFSAPAERFGDSEPPVTLKTSVGAPPSAAWHGPGVLTRPLHETSTLATCDIILGGEDLLKADVGCDQRGFSFAAV